MVSEDELDRLVAESVGPYLRVYVTVRLRERGDGDVAQALEELYAGLLATDAFVGSGERQAFQGRLYGIVDRALPHLGRAGLRRPVDLTRARRFVAHVEAHWHGGYEAYVDALLALPSREREALLARDFHAEAMHEVARRLGVSRDEARAFVNGVRAKVSARA
jgi:DNA-directed RNA polymerase specialized sigma24 family protein